MSLKRSKFNRYKVNSLIDVGRRVVLCHIFTIGTPSKSDATPLDKYLAGLPPNSTANYSRISSKEKKFNPNELQQIHNDATCTTFDVSLLWKAIKLACESVADYNDSNAWKTPSTRMEYYVTAIKDERNNSMHGVPEITTQEFLDTAAKLRKLFHDALGAAKIRYRRSDAELTAKIQEVNDEFYKVMLEVLGEDDLLMYCGPQLKQSLILETNKVLKEHFMNSLNLDPMSFLNDIKLHIHVQKVFTEIKVTRGRIRGEGESFKYENLVEVARSGPKPSEPQVLFVEGIAGSGKTTYVTLVTDEWLRDAKDRTITGLDYYDLLLRVQCRERKIISLYSLFENEMPDVFLKFRSLALPLVKQCKILILIDGLDECNEDSEKLIDDILTRMKTANGCTILFTSRPEGITRFISRVPHMYQVSYIELIGIPKSCRALFVRRYHEEIKQKIGDTQDTEKLVEKVHEVLKKEHFRLPLNMVFLTWIYIHDPSAITTTTTQTQLYYSTYKLCQQKLLDRLARHSATRSSDRRELEIRLKDPMETIQFESLLALWRSQLTLEAEAEDHIRISCKTHGIPHAELLSAFLTLKAKKTHLGIIGQYSAPHKGLQDFYAAMHIATHRKLGSTSATVKEVLQEALGKLDKGLRPLQNVLYHVAGLLHLPPSMVTQTVSEELLRTITREIVDMLYESGLRMRERWLDLVEDTRVNPTVLRRVAPYFAAQDKYEYVFTFNEIEEDVKETEGTNVEKKIDKQDQNIEEEKSKEKQTRNKGKIKTDGSNPSFPKKIKTVGIYDTRIDCSLPLILLLPPCEIKILLEQDPGPRMADLINATRHHFCISLLLSHHFRKPNPAGTSDQLLQHMLPRSKLLAFRGLLTESSLHLLPPSLRGIELAITDDDHAARTLSALHSVYHKLPVLSRLGVNEQLIGNACRVAEALQCPGGYQSLYLPRASLSSAGWQRLLEGLAEARVQVKQSINMKTNDENLAQLKIPAKDKLGCDVRFEQFLEW
ncbi:uncharacterized protein LOC135093870 isoform X2 [Scylla paramamosain]|uniref:uncharacterized protein LOC135093870 isoform X2 n=1 Tax=Scylla paramamosain TaxID=85552 RepID=UPI0030831A12